MSSGAAQAKILIIDDHPLIREGLTARISRQRNLVVCGEAATDDEALRCVRETLPDLVIVDIFLKTGHGIDVIKRIKSEFPAIKLLVFSGFAESLYAERALRAGASGYVNKQDSNEKLLEAIHAVLQGQLYVGPELSRQLINQALGGSDNSKPPINRLSDRELEVYRMIGQGLTSGVIAERLFLSHHTIDSHRENIKRKLDIKNAGELVRSAVQWVLENP